MKMKTFKTINTIKNHKERSQQRINKWKKERLMKRSQQRINKWKKERLMKKWKNRILWDKREAERRAKRVEERQREGKSILLHLLLLRNRKKDFIHVLFVAEPSK